MYPPALLVFTALLPGGSPRSTDLEPRQSATSFTVNLDQKYSGVVVSTSSRFYTVINKSRGKKANTIIVRSPQFKDAVWEYNVVFGEKDSVRVSQPEE